MPLPLEPGKAAPEPVLTTVKVKVKPEEKTCKDLLEMKFSSPLIEVVYKLWSGDMIIDLPAFTTDPSNCNIELE